LLIGSIEDIRLREYNGPGYTSLTQCTAFKYLGVTIHQEGCCISKVELELTGPEKIGEN